MDGSQGELFGAGPLDAGAVRRFLSDNPDFLRGDEGLLAELGLKVDAANVVDFGPAALARVHAAHQREAEMRVLLEETARANFSAQAQIHGAVIDLLDAKGHGELAERVNVIAKARFGLTGAVIAVESEGAAPRGWRRLVQGQVDLILGFGCLSLMGFQPVALPLFGDARDHIRSMAMVRMAIWETSEAVLAFGSADPEGFTPDMGAELVAFLARVVERTAERWPAP